MVKFILVCIYNENKINKNIQKKKIHDYLAGFDFTFSILKFKLKQIPDFVYIYPADYQSFHRLIRPYDWFNSLKLTSFYDEIISILSAISSAILPNQFLCCSIANQLMCEYLCFFSQTTTFPNSIRKCYSSSFCPSYCGLMTQQYFLLWFLGSFYFFSSCLHQSFSFRFIFCYNILSLMSLI